MAFDRSARLYASLTSDAKSPNWTKMSEIWGLISFSPISRFLASNHARSEPGLWPGLSRLEVPSQVPGQQPYPELSIGLPSNLTRVVPSKPTSVIQIRAQEPCQVPNEVSGQVLPGSRSRARSRASNHARSRARSLARFQAYARSRGSSQARAQPV